MIKNKAQSAMQNLAQNPTQDLAQNSPQTPAQILTPNAHIKKPMPLLLKSAIFGLAMFFALILLAPIFIQHAPDAIDLDMKLAPIDSSHWLGTDHLGRDIFARLIEGARISLSAAFFILVLIFALGLAFGGISGFVGGVLDNAIMRLCDLFLCVPTIVLSLFFVGVLGSGLENVIIAIALTHWAWYARLIRSIVFSLKNREYVELSFIYGASKWQNFKRNMLVPVFSQVIVLLTMDIGHIILHIAGLSFLGLGVQAPQAEWGVMLSDSREFMWSDPLLALYPGLALFATIALFNALGEGLRDYLDIDLGAVKCE
ncbi:MULTISPECIES: nickel ABC transporter permease subunit NikC [unclassified Helicobacter]|uniref:nickel ABC transporter permease subunit NikC n=1 Tax=unclassified Helicobacter TaxID=2593540 RepID=UPI001F1A6283|nr:MULTISPECIES: nickel ABC transporter permease subunit NikC [unclassified Helicobacter]